MEEALLKVETLLSLLKKGAKVDLQTVYGWTATKVGRIPSQNGVRGGFVTLLLVGLRCLSPG